MLTEGYVHWVTLEYTTSISLVQAGTRIQEKQMAVRAIFPSCICKPSKWTAGIYKEEGKERKVGGGRGKGVGAGRGRKWLGFTAR